MLTIQNIRFVLDKARSKADHAWCDLNLLQSSSHHSRSDPAWIMVPVLSGTRGPLRRWSSGFFLKTDTQGPDRLGGLGCTVPGVKEGMEMLVLTRKVGEEIIIGDDIYVTVVAIHGATVRIGISAPKEVVVDRQEIAEKRNLRSAQPAFSRVPSV